MSSVGTLAVVLRRVVGGQLKQSGHGSVWHDERTWHDLSAALIGALAGAVVLVDRAHYDELVRDAAQMRRVRAHVEEYYARGPRISRQNGESNAYVRWANENMKPEEKK